MTGLARLAELAGIEAGWWDFFGNRRVVTDETRRAVLAAMGIAAGDDAAVARSLARLEERPWRRWLEPVTVLVEGAPPAVAVTMPDASQGEVVSWSLEEELGILHRGDFRPLDLPLQERRQLGDGGCTRRLFTLPDAPPLGYHRLRLACGQAAAEAMLIVAPARAHTPAEMADGQRLWGVAAQVYSLRSPRNWGMGDYSDLRELATEMAGLGAATVGVNPLHALFPNRPELYSPYSPSSRVFINVMYLDVEAIPDLADSPEGQAMLRDRQFVASLAELRGRDKVDYVGVARLKMMVLRAVYADFRRRHLGEAESDRGGAFRVFQRQGGRAAELFATFEALQEYFLNQAPPLGYWRHWPAAFRHPATPDVAEFARANRAQVEFFWYLQWQAEVQLAAVASACAAGSMPIGLYRDLGVGIADDGAEAWARQDLLCLGVTVGAPPDPLNHRGQDWGLTPYDPMALREAAYQPFIETVRANMRHCGALRLDHAMQLQRLYWVPRGASPEDGAYVRFPVDDLVAILALESRRARCLVIGEDLGTVPEGFRERMFTYGIFGYRLLVFERRADGSFKSPAEFLARALVAVGTHDLPSLVGYWRGSDVELRARLDLYTEPDMAERERQGRQADRAGLVAALRAEGLLPEGFPDRDGADGEHLEQLFEAAHRYLDRTPCDLMMVHLEDALLLDVQLNMPGTVDQHPNWRYRLPRDAASIAGEPRLRRLARRLLDHRCAPRQRERVRLDDA